MPSSSRPESLKLLLHHLRSSQPGGSPLHTDCPALDRLLPGGAFTTGTLVEWLAVGPGGGAGSLAMWVASQALSQAPGSLVVTDREGRFYPPAALAEVDPAKLIVARLAGSPKHAAREELWALDQALRCPGVCVVLAWLEKLEPRAFRRLQLAAEAGQTLGLLIRPAAARTRPTWAAARLLVEPRPTPAEISPADARGRYCHVTLLRQRCRTGLSSLEGTRVELVVDSRRGTVTEVDRHAAVNQAAPDPVRQPIC